MSSANSLELYRILECGVGVPHGATQRKSV